MVLSGGAGGARLVEGLAMLLDEVAEPEPLTVVANTGDDEEFFGLHVSPDVDILLYTLAGIVDRGRGWGLAGDTTAVLDALERLGEPAWFRLGDRDLAVHMLRTAWLRQGRRLTEVTLELARRLGVRVRVLPMSDDPVRTRVLTEMGDLAFQEYFVRHRTRPAVRAVRFQGAEQARIAPEVAQALETARLVVLAPSNPVVSMGPILAVPGVRERLRKRRGRVAVSPLAGGRAWKGPTVEMMEGLGMRPDALGVAAEYRGLIDVFIMDPLDGALATHVEAMGIRPVLVPLSMPDGPSKRRVARAVLDAAPAAAEPG